MAKKINYLSLFFIGILFLTSCGVSSHTDNPIKIESVTSIEELTDTEYFRDGALEHILEGEVNHKGQAVGFHYDRLETKKGEIVPDTKTALDAEGVYEAEVLVEGVEKVSNQGKSTFFPDTFDTQEVVDAIVSAYHVREYISGNTYEGITEDGLVIRMYLDKQDHIISAFPVYQED